MRTTRIFAAVAALGIAAACGPRDDTTFEDTTPGIAPAPAPEMQPAPPPPAPAPGMLPGDTFPMDTLGAPGTTGTTPPPPTGG
jgi:hypothetical protein